MDRTWNQYLQRLHTATIPSPVLPQNCPNCGAEIRWGWITEEEIDEPVIEPADEWPCGSRMREAHMPSWCSVRIQCIPRPDQTVFCPNCEAQILN